MLHRIILIKSNRWLGDFNYELAIKLEFPNIDLLGIFNYFDGIDSILCSPRKILDEFTCNKTSSLFLITEFSTRKRITNSRIKSNIKSGFYDISPEFRIINEKSKVIYNKYSEIDLLSDFSSALNVREVNIDTVPNVGLSPFITIRLIILWLYENYKTGFIRSYQEGKK